MPIWPLCGLFGRGASRSAFPRRAWERYSIEIIDILFHSGVLILRTVVRDPFLRLPTKHSNHAKKNSPQWRTTHFADFASNLELYTLNFKLSRVGKQHLKKRVDLLLVERALVASREKAQALILAGKVFVNGDRVEKAGKLIQTTADLHIVEKDHPYVSRGGVKLESALKRFNFSPKALTALDIGASTGGFTHCLLLQGVGHVFAVDVGYGQLAWELRRHPQVTSLERTNIRSLEYSQIGRSVDLVVIDASFISLKLIFPAVFPFLKSGGHVIALVKPQFEAGKSDVEKRGVVRGEVHGRVIAEITKAAQSQGFHVLQWHESVIEGKKSGNKEFFVFLQK